LHCIGWPKPARFAGFGAGFTIYPVNIRSSARPRRTSWRPFALMGGSHAQWQFSGAYAANALGLSEQVPAKIVILTDGVPRRVSLGKLVLDFRRVAPRNLIGAGRRAGLVIQALRYLHGSPEMLQHLTRLKRDLDANTKKDLALLAPKLSAWMRPLAEEIARN
jgi:hypothetical protein